MPPPNPLPCGCEAREHSESPDGEWPVIYTVECYALIRDPLIAACGHPASTFRGAGNAQQAIDLARRYVREYSDANLPQARVYRTHQRGKRRGVPDQIFTCFCKPDGEIEERHVEAPQKAKGCDTCPVNTSRL